MTSPVTAVGRLLRPKHGEPRILLRVRRNPLTKRLHTVTLRILDGIPELPPDLPDQQR